MSESKNMDWDVLMTGGCGEVRRGEVRGGEEEG